MRLAGALAASLLGHLLILNWAVPLSAGDRGGTGRPARFVLRATLTPMSADTGQRGQRVVSPGSNEGEAVPREVPAESSAVPAGALPTPATDARHGTNESEGGIRLLGYHPVASLSRRPEALGSFELPPIAGGDTGLAGRVEIRIWIGAKGDIDSLRLLSSSLPAAYDRAALDAFEKLRFTPGEINGMPVSSWVDVVVEFADFGSEKRSSAGEPK